MVSIENFGMLSNGQQVKKYIIKDKKEEYVELLDFGATIHSINVLDKKGNIGDVVLGINKASDLEKNSFAGITIGRCANRIEYGKCVIDGKEIQLERNLFGKHFLHGASGNYGFRHFEGKINEEENSVSFYLQDKGEGGFNCNVDAEITFKFDNDSNLKISYKMIPYGTTILCPTNHTYFNLNGGDVRKLKLQINSDKIVNRKEEGLVTSGTHSVIGTPADFTKMRTIMEAMDSDDGTYFERTPKRFDEVYVLPKNVNKKVASLYDDITGREVDVYTDAEALIIFNGIAENDSPQKNNIIYKGYCGFCMETQFVPNAINCKGFSLPVFRKGEQLISETIYSFKVIRD